MIVETVKRINVSQLFTFKFIIPISRYGKIVSKILVNAKARPKNNNVAITCRQKTFPPFTEAANSLKEKSFRKYMNNVIIKPKVNVYAILSK